MLDPYLTPYAKINSNCIKTLNLRLSAIKLLEENVGKRLDDVGFGNDFLAMTSKANVLCGKYIANHFPNTFLSKGTSKEEAARGPRQT